MKLVSKFLTGLALLTSMATASAAPVYVEAYTGPGDMSFKSDSWSTAVYSNISFKINNRYSLTPELAWSAKYSDIALNHTFLRFVVSDSNVAKLGDWTLKAAYRWTAPTTLAAQAAGTYGTFMYRPAFSGKIGPLPTTIRIPLSLPLNRNGYQENPVGSSTVRKGNAVFGSGIEILPSVDLGDVWDLGFVIIVAQKLTHPAQGAEGFKWTHTSDFEVEVGYTVKELADLRFALNMTTAVSDAASFGDAFKVFKKDNTSLSVGLTKTF